MNRRLLLVLISAAFAVPAWGSSPSLGTILPRGFQRGTDAEIHLHGARIGDAVELMIYDSTITVSAIEAVDDNHIKAMISVPADARLGEYVVRVRAKSGISEVRTFYVGPFPTVPEVEPNTDFESPQAVGLNVTVAGVAQREDADHFVVEAKKGQRISAEVEAMRLATTLFDPYVAILDSKRFELAASDDSALALQDPYVSIIAPEDGKYIIQVRESSYAGNDNCHYRLHVGTFPRPAMAFPAGGRPGETITVTFKGDVAGEFTQEVALPAVATEAFPIFPTQNGETAPSPCYLRVADVPGMVEVEPNNSVAEATKAEAAPVTFDGILSEPGDADFFRFAATKGQVFDINVFGRRLRSPIDAVLNVFHGDGKHIAGADDSGGPDSYLRFQAPEDGEYVVRVLDHLSNGSADRVYRAEVALAKPNLSLTFPQVARYSQDRWAMAVPQGNRFATLVVANRSNFGGELNFSAEGLPAGMALSAKTMPDATGTMPIVFEAAADAPLAGSLSKLSAAHVDANTGIAGGYLQKVDLVHGEPNQTPYYWVNLDRLAVGVTEAVPFKIDLVPPKVPLVQNGSLNLKVVATRAEGFTAPITVYFPWAPPGVGSAASAVIPEGQNEVDYPLNANGNAAVRTWPVVVIGHANVGNGPIWVSTQLIDLTVAPPYATLSIEMAATEQGKPTEVVAKVQMANPWEGSAKINLVGLPAGTASKEIEFTKDSAEVVFPVTVEPTSPVGQHKSLFCQFIVTQQGEANGHNSGHGGVLRIDAPPPAPATPAPAQAAEAPKPPTEKRLTRLEQLRLEQAERVRQAIAAAEGSGN